MCDTSTKSERGQLLRTAVSFLEKRAKVANASSKNVSPSSQRRARPRVQVSCLHARPFFSKFVVVVMPGIVELGRFAKSLRGVRNEQNADYKWTLEALTNACGLLRQEQ